MSQSHEHPHPHDHPHPHSHGEAVGPPKDWFQRNWKWFIPLGCGGALFLFVAFIGGITMLVFGMIKNSDAYGEALERVRSHPEAVAGLGLPIEPGFLVSGSINVSGSSGDADLAIPVTGSRASGTIYVVATKEAGEWTYQRLELELESGERIDLLSVSAPAGVQV